MDFMRWMKIRQEFYEREGYYPAFGETQRREMGQQIEQAPEWRAGRPLMPRKRRRPWK